MRLRSLLWFLLSVVCFVGAVYFWRLGDRMNEQQRPAAAASAPTNAFELKRVNTVKHASTAPVDLFTRSADSTNAAALSVSNISLQVKYRVSNTPKTAGQLAGDSMAILLANALIDLRQPMNLSIPDSLKAKDDPGAYIVQARGPINDLFRSRLQQIGAEIVSYIPNNAYLVRASTSQARQLRGSMGVQAVLAYEPYYKVDARLLDFLLNEKSTMPRPEALNVVVFNDALEPTREALENLGGRIVGQGMTPFGMQFTVAGLNDIPAVAGLPGIGNVEAYTPRRPATDLARVRVGIAPYYTNEDNYVGLMGNNVMVQVNDSGVNGSHPDLTGRVFGPASTNDPNGHGTHVGVIIAGDGSQSTTVSNASGSILPPVDKQFRGMAPQATLYALQFDDPFYSDFELQQEAAKTNAWISNNSWGYGDNGYNIASASFDAAVRDSLPSTSGSQPVLYVFAAGNEGNGDDNGLGGSPQSILSPGTAKNVITVGAIEQFRGITNEVVAKGVTNAVWEAETDSQDQVAAFSSRGNVGIGVEGDFGRVKPDVVAPGVFLVSGRSPDWDEAAYYNPTSYIGNTLEGQVVQPDSLQRDSVYVPGNAVGLIVKVWGQAPDVDLPIYVRENDFPTSGDPSGINRVELPGTAPLTTETVWFYSVGNPTNVPVRYNVSTTLILTNELGDYYTVLSNLNNELGDNYRYESGTSMAAPVVSGTLALIADFFTNHLSMVPSPALMKAMLINGARPVSGIYDLDPRKDSNAGDIRNYQGWGLINLTNSLPFGFVSNSPSIGKLMDVPTPDPGTPIFVVEQDPTNALATADSRTFNIQVQAEAVDDPLRITLVWTDPPGNPAAGIKLVNDLDLVVTNIDANLIYYGNDIPEGANFTTAIDSTDTNVVARVDNINNVESVIIPPPLATNYSITVYGRAVNVNAITAHTNKVAQDYALVISSGLGTASNAFKVTSASSTSVAYTNVTYMTNQFGGDTNSTVTGGMLLNQHVGANSPLIGNNNTVPLGTGTTWGEAGANGVLYLGTTNQWHFYVLTNENNYTNAAFITFLPPTLAVPRMGGTNYDQSEEISRFEGDIDMYVTTDSRLLQLDPAVFNSSTTFKAVTRGGTEVIGLTNATSFGGNVFYVGIHAQDQQAAEYGFFGGFSLLPFSEEDGNGVRMRAINVPQIIPDGSPAQPGAARILSICIQPLDVRRVIVTNLWITHENFGDLVGNLSHGQQFAVLHNHMPNPDPDDVDVLLTFEDNEENDFPALRSEGPGSLRDFVGERGEGLWLLTEIDDALGYTGRVNDVTIRLERQPDPGADLDLDIATNSFRFTYVDVPPEATNLIISILNNTGPLELYLRRDNFPTRTEYDHFFEIPAGGATNSISTESNPPLQPGRYYIGVYNPTDDEQTVTIRIDLEYLMGEVATIDLTHFGPDNILDDAITYSSIHVPYDRRIARVDVGVAIQHPRISDLALTLIAPNGKRVLLAENRGAETANMGFILPPVTNTFETIDPIFAITNSNVAVTNTLAITNTSGVLVIDFDFYTQPDMIDVYYGDTNIFSSGLVNSNGTFTIPFGPGEATNIMIVVNRNNPNNPGTAWTITPSIITQEGTYFVFSENDVVQVREDVVIPAKTQLPIKFAIPPFIGSSNRTVGPLILSSDFNSAGVSNYPPGSSLDGWTTTGPADVEADLSGGAYVSLPAASAIETNVPAGSGTEYVVSFRYALGAGPAASAGADIMVGDANISLIAADPIWQKFSTNYTGAASLLTFAAHATNESAILFDDIEVRELGQSVTNYYFPEESLEDLIAESALGEWQLEIWDNRVGPAGVTNAPQLLSWQLRFVFDRESTPTISLEHDVPQTNSIPECSMQIYSVNVPLWAQYITNTLISVDPPINVTVFFTTNSLPTTNDIAAGSGTFDMWPLSTTTNGGFIPPQVVPGGRYYIGVLNPCGSGTNVSVAFKIEFDTTPLENAVPVTGTNDVPSLPRYFYFDVSPDATAVTFQLTNMSADFNLVVRRGGPLPTVANNHYGSFNPGTMDEDIIVFPDSRIPLAPGRWYLGVFNNSGVTNGVYTIVASEHTNAFPTIITLTNGIPYANTIPPGGVQYYRYLVSPNGVRAQFEVLTPSGDVALAVRKGLPLPSIGDADYESDNPSLNNEWISIVTNSTPVQLTPGNWFLAVTNHFNVPVTYNVKATEWLSTGRPVTVIDTVYNPPFGTNGATFCITWSALPGVPYYVQAVTNLADTNWINVSGTIVADGFIETYCVPVTGDYQFFRVVEGFALESFPQPLNFRVGPATYLGTNGFMLTWSGLATSVYQLQWTTNLSPAVWTAFNPTNLTSTNMFEPHGYTNGIYSFFDDGTQPTPAPEFKFYRVLLLE